MTDAQRDQDPAAGWEAAGTDDVLLPTGTAVRLLLPGAGSLARRGITPGVLREVVARLSGGSGTPGGMDPDDWERWESAIRDVIAEMVTAIRLPDREGFSAHRIEPDHRVPPQDLDALTSIALRLVSPAQVDAETRTRLKGLPAHQGGATWARAAHDTVGAWTEFATSDEGLMCAVSARVWGCRPSDLLSIGDRVVAYAVDEALALRLLGWKKSAAKGPFGDYYEPIDTIPYDPEEHARSQAARIAELREAGLLH